MGDITYIRTDEGWLYLAVMLDIYSRQVVGWQMSRRIDRHLETFARVTNIEAITALK